MYVYIFILVLALACAFLLKQGSTKSTAYLACWLAALALFVGFSDMLGGYDRYIYAELFDEVADVQRTGGDVKTAYIFELYPSEFGFSWLNVAVSYITANRYIFILILTIVIYALLFISFKNFRNFEFSLNFGDILTILCALGFALNILLFSKIKKFNINVINITVIQMLAIGILAFIFQIIFEKKVINFSMNFSLIYLILICTMLNFTIQNISQKYVPAHIMGLILSLEAIFGTVFAIIFLNETISQNFIIGTLLIAIAVILIQYFENKRGD